MVMERGGRAALGRELPIPDVVGALSLLITHGPSALAANLGVQEMLSMAVGRLPQVSPSTAVFRCGMQHYIKKLHCRYRLPTLALPGPPQPCCGWPSCRARPCKSA